MVSALTVHDELAAAMARLYSDTDFATIDRVLLPTTDGTVVTTLEQRAGAGKQTLFVSGSGNDTITGAGTNEVIYGGGGNDTIYGGAGRDIIAGGIGNDTLDGGDGNDVILGGDGDDRLYGGNGNDLIDGGAGFDVLQLSSLNPVNNPTPVNLTLRKLAATSDTPAGFEAINGTDIERVVNVEATSLSNNGDRLNVRSLGPATLAGQATSPTPLLKTISYIDFMDDNETGYGDTLDLTAISKSLSLDFQDRLNQTVNYAGLLSPFGDELVVRNAKTVLLGGGNDTFVVSQDDSAVAMTVDSGAGNDKIAASHGSFNVKGGAGTDVITFGQGASGTIEGGVGNDTIDATAAFSPFREYLEPGNVNIVWSTGDGFDTIRSRYDFSPTGVTWDNFGDLFQANGHPTNIRQISMNASINDFKLVFTESLIQVAPITHWNGQPIYLCHGDLKLIDKATGLSGIDLGDCYGVYTQGSGGGDVSTIGFNFLPWINFTDGPAFESGPDYSVRRIDVQFNGTMGWSTLPADMWRNEALQSDYTNAVSVQASNSFGSPSVSSTTSKSVAGVAFIDAYQSVSSSPSLASKSLESLKAAQQLTQALSSFGASSASEFTPAKFHPEQVDSVFAGGTRCRDLSSRSMAIV